MQKDINVWATKRAGCKVRDLTQNALAHAKYADPRKVRGPTQSAWAALWVRGTPSARTRAKCVGRGSIARAALSARAAIAWRGEWAALPTHLPRTCHSMPTQCNRGSTRVGRDEPQSPGTLRVNTIASLWRYTSASGALSVLSLIRAEIYISYNAKTKTHTKDNIAIRMLKHPHSKDIKRSKEPMLENRKSSFDILIQIVYLTSQPFIIPYSQNKLDLFETMLEFVCVCSWRRTMKHIWNVTVWCVSEPGNTRINIGKIFWFRPC